jgi:hypothetical protein
MQTEALQEADRRRKNQCSSKRKRQSTVVGLLFALITCTQETEQEEDGRASTRDSQGE